MKVGSPHMWDGRRTYLNTGVTAYYDIKHLNVKEWVKAQFLFTKDFH